MAAYYLGPILAVGARAEADLATQARATGDADAEAEAIARVGRLMRDANWKSAYGTSPEAALQVATEAANVASARAELEGAVTMPRPVTAGPAEVTLTRG